MPITIIYTKHSSDTSKKKLSPLVIAHRLAGMCYFYLDQFRESYMAYERALELGGDRFTPKWRLP